MRKKGKRPQRDPETGQTFLFLKRNVDFGVPDKKKNENIIKEKEK